MTSTGLTASFKKGGRPMSQRKLIEEALKKLGITTEAQLNAAIRNLKPLNLSLMAQAPETERKAG